MRIYPNPATHNVRIAVADEILSVELVPATVQANSVRVDQKKMDVPAIASGFYVLKVYGK